MAVADEVVVVEEGEVTIATMVEEEEGQRANEVRLILAQGADVLLSNSSSE